MKIRIITVIVLFVITAVVNQHIIMENLVMEAVNLYFDKLRGGKV